MRITNAGLTVRRFCGPADRAAVITNTNFPATGVWGDGTSLSLQPGDWDVSAMLDLSRNNATITQGECGISTTSGNNTTGLTLGNNRLKTLGPTTTYNAAICIPCYRMVLTSTTTVYLKVKADYSAGTPRYTCRLSARRMA